MSALRRLQAPQENRGILAEPALTEVGPLLARNRQVLSDGPPLLDVSWLDLRRSARHDVLAAATDYLQRAGEPTPTLGTGAAASLLLSGHQPELMHPGVWVKNFALQGLARAHGVTPLNLVVDNDTAKTTSLRLPVLESIQPLRASLANIPFDHWSGEMPYEERPVRNPELFAAFAARTAPVWKAWGFAPLLPEFWAEVRRQAERTSLLGECFAAARRTCERRWGAHNLEVPVSVLCQTESFARFACHLLLDLPRFHAVHNTAVHEYRRLHGLRSRNHPVPDLAADGAWYEAPLWGWRTGQARRGRLFVRRTDTTLELRAGDEPWPALPADGDHGRLVRSYQELEHCGFKVRSRALTNTLFARVFVADLFLHGIGGGKYDELTDLLIRRFYGVEPPRYLVVSATLRLPLPPMHVAVAQRTELARLLRRLRFNPQQHLAQSDGAARELAARKNDWIGRNPPDAAGRKERCRVLRDCTEQLRPFVADLQRQTEAKLIDCDRQLLEDEVLRQRDYAFVLFPEDLLRPFCTQFLDLPG